MYVCLCRGVTKRAVLDALREGARTLGAVGRACGAGRVCGGCRPEICRLLAELPDQPAVSGGAVSLRLAGESAADQVLTGG